MNHPLRDGHPDDAALGDTPLVSLGQGDYRRDIMPGDVSKGHTQAAEKKALDALTRDAQRSGTVPLADKKPAETPEQRAYRDTKALAVAKLDRAESYLADNVRDVMILSRETNKTARDYPHSRTAQLVNQCVLVALGRVGHILEDRESMEGGGS